jgi:SAM-dependent methyltransferase
MVMGSYGKGQRKPPPPSPRGGGYSPGTPEGPRGALSLMRGVLRSSGEAGTEARLRVGKMMSLMEPPPGSKVLLMGEGEGMLASRLADLPGVEATWLEPLEAVAEPQPSPLPSRGYSRLLGDYYNLPFPAGGFDFIASQLTLENLEQPGMALAEWARVLKEGGALILATVNRLFKGREQRPSPRPRQSYSPEELKKSLAPFGFEVILSSTLMPDLKLSALYRGDISFFLFLEDMPCLRDRGRLLFVKAIRGGGRP